MNYNFYNLSKQYIKSITSVTKILHNLLIEISIILLGTVFAWIWHFFSRMGLCVLEMWFLRLAKAGHKLFWTQFLFGTKIKSTYKNVLQNTKILDLSVKRGSQCPIPVLGPRQKWVDFPPTFFALFINFLVVCHLLLNIQKILLWHFSILAKYGPFCL